MLVFFGVIFDMLHVMLDPLQQSILFEILEEGGEMVMISVMVWYVHRLTTISAPTP
jgi:hypothetical protein